MTATQFIKGNIIWVITTLFFLGVIFANIKFQERKLDTSINDIKENRISIQNIEKTMVKIGGIEQDISEIKDDCKAIKAIILKPAFNVNRIASSERDIKNNNM